MSRNKEKRDVSYEMTSELRKLLEDAKKRRLSDGEREAQRISFAYGNVRIHNERITRKMIEEVELQEIEERNRRRSDDE